MYSNPGQPAFSPLVSPEEALAFLPEPRLNGNFTAPIDLPGAIFECSSEAVTISRRGERRSIDTSQSFSAVLSRGRDPSVLFLELRQRQDGQWQRLALKTRTRNLGPLDALPQLELVAPNMAESDFTTVLAFVRGAMQLLGRENWGLSPDLPPMSSGPLIAVGAAELPENMKFWIQGGALYLQYPWAYTRRRGPALVLFLLIGIIFISLLAAIFQSTLVTVAGLFAVLGVGVYVLVAFAQNETTVRVDNRSLSIEHGPIKWFPVRPVEASRIEQIFCREDRTDGREASTFLRTYSVVAVLGEKERAIARGLSEPEQAFYIERQIERFLAIADVPVVGELPRDHYPRTPNPHDS
ncbi:MAG: hypothetical protein RBU37_07855 [Myxococcota bacterium]|nr:hypothetical protein [Myxococcota bacterium]